MVVWTPRKERETETSSRLKKWREIDTATYPQQETDRYEKKIEVVAPRPNDNSRVMLQLYDLLYCYTLRHH